MSTLEDRKIEKPVIVIVPASFSPPSLYRDVVERLGDTGFKTIVIDLPSIGSRAPLAGATMTDDVNCIRSITNELVDDGKDIILVMHSYGGICGTESTKGVSKVEREKLRKEGGIIRLLYISSPVPEVGGSIASQMGANMPDFITVEGDYLVAEPNGCARTNFSDLPSARGIELAKTMLVHSAVSFTGTLTHPGYQDIPVSYLVCEEDQAVPVEVQKSIIARIQKESGHGVAIQFCKSGHFPSVSRTEEVVRNIRRAAGETLREITTL